MLNTYTSFYNKLRGGRKRFTKKAARRARRKIRHALRGKERGRARGVSGDLPRVASGTFPLARVASGACRACG